MKEKLGVSGNWGVPYSGVLLTRILLLRGTPYKPRTLNLLSETLRNGRTCLRKLLEVSSGLCSCFIEIMGFRIVVFGVQGLGV